MRKIFSFIVGLFIFSCLPIAGWGLNNIKGFIQNPYRITYIIMMAILSVLVVIFVPNEGSGEGEEKKLVKRHKLTLLFLQILPSILIILSLYFDRHGFTVFKENNSIRLTDVVLTFIGFLFMNWSVIILDRQFSVDVTIQESHKLVTYGPYKYIRHPRYLGIFFFTGISLVFLSGISLIIVLFTLIVLLWRIRDEEKLMHQEFGKDWEEYKKRTFSLVPYIY
jgi:protein-S-isoprenylcysteine O-methyltransferase Ste14